MVVLPENHVTIYKHKFLPSILKIDNKNCIVNVLINRPSNKYLGTLVSINEKSLTNVSWLSLTVSYLVIPRKKNYSPLSLNNRCSCNSLTILIGYQRVPFTLIYLSKCTRKWCVSLQVVNKWLNLPWYHFPLSNSSRGSVSTHHQTWSHCSEDGYGNRRLFEQNADPRFLSSLLAPYSEIWHARSTSSWWYFASASPARSCNFHAEAFGDRVEFFQSMH